MEAIHLPPPLKTSLKTDFKLQKWYVDVADQQGNLYIGYWGTVGWKGLEIPLYQQLWQTAADGLKTQTRIGREQPPTWQSDSQLSWSPAHTVGGWQSAASKIEQTLIESEHGDIRWVCYQPKAKAAVTLPDLTIEGWGYTESIDITIQPWKLPFKTLYWGRSHTKNHHLVWIKFDGLYAQNLLWHNGRLIHDWQINDHAITTPNFRLTFDNPAPIRQGQLISTIFKPFHKLTSLFPQATFMADERKWFSHGRFITLHEAESATTIYEKVTW